MTRKYERGERSMFNFNDSFRVISPLRIFAFKVALLEGLCSIARSSRTKYLNIKKRSLPTNPKSSCTHVWMCVIFRLCCLVLHQFACQGFQGWLYCDIFANFCKQFPSQISEFIVALCDEASLQTLKAMLNRELFSHAHLDGISL